MEIIITLVIVESDGISSKLLSALLNTSRTNKKDVQPTAEKLAKCDEHFSPLKKGVMIYDGC